MYAKLNPDLAAREIRLLHISAGAWNDPIECVLQTVSINDNPQFKAISYVWGDPQQTKPITLNGQSFTVTHNLFTGLQRIRRPTGTAILWADALCINQADLDERSLQVQLMGNIYSSAEDVLIWLGYGRNSIRAPGEQPMIYEFTGKDRDQILIDAYFERYLAGDAGAEVEPGDTEDALGAFVFLKLFSVDKHIREMPFFHKNEAGLLTIPEFWLKIARALHALSVVPWWTRVWTLQEITLARRATVLYGNITAPWALLPQVMDALYRHLMLCCTLDLDAIDTHTTYSIGLAGSAVDLGRKVTGEVQVLRKAKALDLPLSLTELMRWSAYREAAGIRDKVYGLLGLLPAHYKGTNLIPTYNISAREVFINASFVELQVQAAVPGSGLMGLVGTTATWIPDLPSWVTEQVSSYVWRGSQSNRIQHAHHFRAAEGTQDGIRRDGDVLMVDSFPPVDTVACIGPSMFDSESNFTEGQICNIITQVMDTWRQLAGLDDTGDDTYAGKQTWTEAFGRTITNDCIRMDPSKDRESHGPAYRRLGTNEVSQLYERWRNWLQSKTPNSTFNIETNDSTGVTLSEPPNVPSQEELKDVLMLHNACLSATALRRFFISTNGRMGLGPTSILPGDDIHILCGGNVPFCLRKKSDCNYTTLVGDVYVHGLMDGEGVPDNREDKAIRISIG